MPTLGCLDAEEEATGAQKSSFGNRWIGREKLPASFLCPFFHFASADADVYLVKVAESDIRELLLGWLAF